SLTGTVDKEDYGYTVEIPDCSHSLLLNQRIAKFTNFNDDLYKRFLLYFLRSRVFLDELYATARGVRQANLSTVAMKKLSVFFPDVDSQRKLVGKFDNLSAQTNHLITLYTQKLNDLKELKQSLLQQAFAGELTKEDAA
ncbi:restriction endonuclease subunit S, partial [Akkermansiaceae bacterium]|nr:restriction endonuclease subunit S [Akkermansiaceae bacterium]